MSININLMSFLFLSIILIYHDRMNFRNVQMISRVFQHDVDSSQDFRNIFLKKET